MTATTFTIGDIEVLVLSDGELGFPGHAYFNNTPDDWEPHKRWLQHDGTLIFPMNCFVVRSGGKTVLIDTGLGPIVRGTFRGGDLPAGLEAAGVRADDIDTVFLTHLHFDHIGNMAMKDGDTFVPRFPKAAYRWSSDEDAYWKGPIPEGAMSPARMTTAVAGRYEPADGGASLAPGVDVIATPGHTPGHSGVVISSGDQRAFILGDAISCPVQLEETEWSGMGDVDPKLARASQEAVAKEAEASGALLGAAHFPGLTFGRVLRGEGRRYWSPVG
jgi:glyoxylase-like metal-dependent hydrolase (beta-lactamase superfamily II)